MSWLVKSSSDGAVSGVVEGVPMEELELDDFKSLF